MGYTYVRDTWWCACPEVIPKECIVVIHHPCDVVKDFHVFVPYALNNVKGLDTYYHLNTILSLCLTFHVFLSR